MNNNISKLAGGGLLILFGGLWLAANFIPGFNINWGAVWPLFLVIPGLMFWGRYLFSSNRENEVGLLIPANILLLIGLTFYFNIIANDVLNIHNAWVLTVFMYPGSVAIAFWITWLASKREIAFFIPAAILTGITLLVMCGVSGVALIGGQATADVNRIIWPLLIICLGLFVLLSPIWSSTVFKSSKWMGKSKEEWESWGKDFGKKMETAGEKFGKSVEDAFEGKSKSEKKDDEVDVTNAEEAELVNSEKID